MQVKFGPFAFDGASRQLRCGDGPVHISPKAFDLLAVLLRQCPAAVSKEDLHRELWPQTFVSDGSLAVLVTELRRALSDSPQHPRFVRTINRFGYAFVGSVLDDAAAPGHTASSCWLTRGQTRTRLRAGENVVGRDSDADVCIDAVGVSRRHATIVVSKAAAILRDLASKNGTFVDGRRVTSPVTLHDGAEIRFGAVAVSFQQPGPEAPTQTVAGFHEPPGAP
jgi:DNA-binding winged helix-turn-helix (wHTH) protein